MTTYNASPNRCRKCTSAISWRNDLQHKVKVFCSSSCAASFNNSLVPKRKRVIKPIVVKPARPPKPPKPIKLSRQELKEQEFRSGMVSKRLTLRKILFRLYGYACMNCKGTEWNGMPMPLELDHIDGNAGNNMPSNLRLLCPNCHAQTPTHKGGNMGYGRRARGLPMQ